jgi:hypothetical protein
MAFEDDGVGVGLGVGVGDAAAAAGAGAVDVRDATGDGAAEEVGDGEALTVVALTGAAEAETDVTASSPITRAQIANNATRSRLTRESFRKRSTMLVLPLSRRINIPVNLRTKREPRFLDLLNNSH